MRRYGVKVLMAVVLIAAAGPLLAGDKPAEDAVRKELQKFEGTWRITSLEMEGMKLPDDQVKQMAARLIIQGDQFTFKDPVSIHKGTFKVDPGKKPKQIDITFTEGPEKGKGIQGIYKLEGDTYTLCASIAGKERPVEFASKPGSGHVLEVLKREQKAAPEEAIKADRKALAGTWQAVSYELDGKKAPAEDLQDVQLVIDADGKAIARKAGQAFIGGTTEIDPTRTPRAIDIAYTVGEIKGQTALGIYEVKGDTLRICRSNPGKDRPTEFSSKPGSGHTLMSYRRVKSN
jgi:uncharacterized protein (TIGR03067 family)